MADQIFNVIFDGRTTGDVELPEVKKKIAAIFKMNATQVEALFSGKPMVIKRGVDEATAKKYKAAFKQAGAICTITSGAQSSSPAAAPAAAATPAQPRNQAVFETGERPTGRNAGKDIVNKKVPSDFGGISVGAAGERIPTLSIDKDFDMPDISELSMSGKDTLLVKPSSKASPDVDTSGLSMEEEE